jgi:hypothetical protein
MSKQFFHIIFCLLLLCITKQAQATHMVGGEINYRCLGNNQYEIMVTVFRDCDTGVPWFDDPASIGKSIKTCGNFFNKKICKNQSNLRKSASKKFFY